MASRRASKWRGSLSTSTPSKSKTAALMECPDYDRLQPPARSRESEVCMRSPSALALLLAFAVPAAGGGGSPVPAEPLTAIRAGTLIDGRSDQARRNQVVVVRGRRIEAVGDAATTPVPPGASVIDLAGATVLPGLIDSHTHVFLQGE